MPPYVASVAAGLLVAQFIRFLTGMRGTRMIRFDVQRLTITIKDLA